MPNGVAFRDGALYVAEVNRILRFRDVGRASRRPPKPEVVSEAFPTDGITAGSSSRFGPDGRLYVPVGAPCNICEPAGRATRRSRASSAGGRAEVFARGVRNTVGFDWHPDTGELWFTDNGRDWLGDDLPPDELNRADAARPALRLPVLPRRGMRDPEFNGGRECSEFTPPARKLGPHVAALGMRFYTGAMFPETYRGRIFIAEHGSWNRSTPDRLPRDFVRSDGRAAPTRRSPRAGSGGTAGAGRSTCS